MVEMNSRLDDMLTPTGVSYAEAEHRAAQLYPQQVTFKQLAAVLAATHPHAIDYLSQCPAIISAISKSSTAWRAEHYAVLAKQFGWRCEANPKLRDLMRSFGLPFPLRKLSGMAVSPRRWEGLTMISTVDPRVIASAIPEKVGKQIAWMKGCTEWAQRLKRMQLIPTASAPSAKVEWFIMAWSRYVVAMSPKDAQNLNVHNVIGDTFDFASSRSVRDGEVAFDERWTWEQAQAAAVRWHALINAEKITASFQKTYGFGPDYEWDVHPWPAIAAAVLGYQFVPLNTGTKVVEEGRAMHHCLRSYLDRLVSSRYVAYSVLDNIGNRVATFGIGRQNVKNAAAFAEQVRNGISSITRASWKIDQIKGPCNAGVRNEITQACRHFFNTAF